MGLAEIEREAREHDEMMMGLAKLRYAGMTYKKLSNLVDNVSMQRLSHHLKPYEDRYKRLCEKNLLKLEESLTRDDPDYAYMTDPRTEAQQNFALLMGGAEIKATLEQLGSI